MSGIAASIPEQTFEAWSAGVRLLEGSWNVKGKAQPASNLPIVEISGTSTIQPILQGGFMQEHLEAEAMGMPYSGVGILGYDRVGNRLNALWVDSFGALIKTSGHYDSEKRVHSLVGEAQDAMSEQPRRVKQVSRVLEGDRHVFEIYELSPAGDERLVIELFYERR